MSRERLVALIAAPVVLGLLITNLVISSDAAASSGVEERLNATVVGIALPRHQAVPGLRSGSDRLQLNGRVEGAVAAEQTTRFTIELLAGSPARVIVRGLEGFDPTAQVYAPAGELVASNDDAYSGTRDAEMVVAVGANGPHAIEVSGFGGMGGRFAVTVTSE